MRQQDSRPHTPPPLPLMPATSDPRRPYAEADVEVVAEVAVDAVLFAVAVAAVVVAAVVVATSFWPLRKEWSLLSHSRS